MPNIIVTPSNYSMQQTVRHPKYYLNGGDLHLLIRGQLFRVHGYFFGRDSTKFLPVSSCGHASPGGDSDKSPIIVDVDPTKFEKLLWVFYNPTYSLYDASVDDWTDILELSHKWEFTQAKQLAIRELEKLTMPTAERIALYQKFNVDCEFLVPLYAELCSRPDILSLEESKMIGMPAAIIIFQLREEFRMRPPSSPPSNPPANEMTRELRIRIAAGFGFPPEAANFEPGPGPANERPNFNSNGRTRFAGGRGTRRS
ncbi:hypothetical protein AX15_006633 [Amanita polypyramis BW_CC]|nr:hypothetical protein AX15_006633 [Amanita polypyramis BW_CC]